MAAYGMNILRFWISNRSSILKLILLHCLYSFSSKTDFYVSSLFCEKKMDYKHQSINQKTGFDFKIKLLLIGFSVT